MDEHFDVVVVGSGFGARPRRAAWPRPAGRSWSSSAAAATRPGRFPRSPRGAGRRTCGTRPPPCTACSTCGPSSGIESRGVAAAWAVARSSTPTCSCARTRPGSSTTAPGSPLRPWPVSYADLEPHYEAAEAMLGAQRYPFDVAPVLGNRQDRGACATPPPQLGLDWQLPHLAVTLRQPRPAAGPERAHRRGAPQPARPAPPYVPAVRRMRHRLQRRRQEHPRLQLPLPGRRRRGRDPHPVRGAPHRSPHRSPAATAIGPTPDASPDGPRRRSQARARQSPWRPPTWSSGAGTFGSTYLLLRNRAAFPQSQPGPGYPLLRQRRPAHLPAATAGAPSAGRRGATAPEPRVRPGHHQRHPACPTRWTATATGRPGLLRRGRRQPALPRLVRPGDGRPAARPSALAAVRWLRRVWAHADAVDHDPTSAATSPACSAAAPASATMLPMLWPWAATSRTAPCPAPRRRDLDLDWTTERARTPTSTGSRTTMQPTSPTSRGRGWPTPRCGSSSG